MDALIRLGCGDMRRTLNILQVRLHGQQVALSCALTALLVLGHLQPQTAMSSPAVGCCRHD